MDKAKITLGEELIDAEIGSVLSDYLSGDSVHMFCGGKGTCGKCKVKAFGALSDMTEQEKSFLSDEEINDGIRLACLVNIKGDCKVVLCDEERDFNVQTLGYMPEIKIDPLFENYGIAIDIGTTTVVSRLYNTSGLVSSVSSYNPQKNFGADVISRIEASLKGEGDDLAACIREEIKDMIYTLTDCKFSPDVVVITGNTAMLYLLTGKNPDSLSHAPFEADDLFGRFIEPEEIGLDFKGKVYLSKCISAFVGADISTAIMSSELCKEGQSNLLVDIGTNGEIVLWHNNKLYCCSTAAGPTFEGAGISMGMSGSTGAIEHVDVIDGKPVIKVIDNAEATGICGSGMIDATAALLELEVIDENGYMEDEEYNLTDKVIVNQKDIRMVQLAKSAICSGILTLMDTCAISENDIDNFYIAGGFGSYLDLNKGAKIGLYPKTLVSKAKVIGNAAVAGASMLLLSKCYIEECIATVKNAETVDLSTNPVFMDNYVDCMMFE